MNKILSFRALRTTALACFVFLMAGMIAGRALAAGYSVISGRIYDASGQEIQIRGISHHGFNSTILQPQFLWSMGWKEQIAQIKALGFNAVRVPFVPDTLYNTTPVDKLSYVDPNKNPELIGKTPLQALDLWMAEANRVGLYVLLDFHSVSMIRQYPQWFLNDPADFNLMYNGQAYTAANWKRDLVFVAQRYAGLQYFFAIDIYNEPNGKVRWSAGDSNMTDATYYWKAAAESAAAAVLAANPNLLIFVQGVEGNYDHVENSNIAMNWAENFQPQAYQPLNIPLAKLVLSPHTYGPDVYPKSSFNAPNFPSNLAGDWETLFGQFANTYAVVPGEWGGRYGNGVGGTKDITWQNAFVDYWSTKGAGNSFFWCYTPNSSDTGGILNDDLSVRSDKLALLQKLWTQSHSSPPPVTTPPPAPTPTPTPSPTPAATISIGDVSPLSGGAGTVVTITGGGLSAITQAWLGNSHNVPVKIVSDAKIQLTIPSDATTGHFGLFTSTQTVFTAQQFTLSASQPAPTPTPTPTPTPAPAASISISSVSPGSGPVGTVVTINGGGLSGINQVWIGNSHNAPVRVISDSQIQITIPADGTTGHFGLFTATQTVFTAQQFTVTTVAQSYPQPWIDNFSPTSGAPGTVVTINGSSLTGLLSSAWVGNARNAPVRVISDKQVQVTIPVGATTGAIGIFNPDHAGFTATAFTVK